MSEYFATLGPEGFGTYQVDWGSGPPKLTKVSKPPHGMLIPGFVDVHIHGAFGIDFMSASKDEMLVLCDKLAEQGYEAFLPTTVTAHVAEIEAALSNLPEHPMILGFHLEGPFISPDFPGAQPKEHIVDPPTSPSEWDAVLDDHRLKLITLAPERPGMVDLVLKLNKVPAIASMGHTNATYDQARWGFEFGITHVTHVFNAMRGFHHREVGALGYALSNDSIYTELIYDKKHVSEEAARLLLKCKPLDHIIAISDSTMATGLTPQTTLTMWGHECVVGKKEVRIKSSNALAGSAITLLDAFRNLVEDFGEEIAIMTCCINPRQELGMKDPPKVYLVLDKNLEIVERRVAQ